MGHLHIFTDGAIRPEECASGLAAIVRDESGQICYWWSRRAGRMTCNEAEYAAVLFALEQLKESNHTAIERIAIYSDSLVLVNQMVGKAAVHSPALCQLHSCLTSLLTQLPPVTFTHIPREANRLADALAGDAVEGFWPRLLLGHTSNFPTGARRKKLEGRNLPASPRLKVREPEEGKIKLWNLLETTWRSYE